MNNGLLGYPQGRGLAVGALSYPLNLGLEQEESDVPPVAGYDLWLDGADADTITLDNNGRVIAWRDKSGSGHAGIASGSVCPYYGSRTLNGFAVPEFQGAQRLDTTCPNSDRTATVFVVALFDSLTTSPTLFASTSGTDGNQLLVADVPPGRLITNREFVAEIARQTNAAVSVGVPHVFVQRLTATAVEQGVDGVYESDADASTFTAGRLKRLGLMHNGGQAFDGLMAEFVSYPVTLSDSEVAAVFEYLRSKWGM